MLVAIPYQPTLYTTINTPIKYKAMIYNTITNTYEKYKPVIYIEGTPAIVNKAIVNTTIVGRG